MGEPTVAERVAGSPVLRRRQLLGRLIARSLARVDVEGLTALPATGAVLLAINHRSLFDGPLVFGFVERPVSCLVKAEAFTPRLAPLLLSAGQIPVVRHRVDPAPVRLCVQLLRAGGVVGIFPEGSRGDGQVRSALPGVGYLALRSGAVVVPVACHGTFDMSHRRQLRRPCVRLVLGTPIPFDRHPDERPLNRRPVAEATEHIRDALCRLVAATAATGHGGAAAPATMAG